MMKYIKRGQVDEEEDSKNESKLSESSVSKAEKEVTDKKIHLYNNSYLTMGFIQTGDKNCPLPLSTVSGKKLSHMAMVPAKLSQHFITNHSHLSNKKTDYFQ
jgi:hypothetical protein